MAAGIRSLDLQALAVLAAADQAECPVLMEQLTQAAAQAAAPSTEIQTRSLLAVLAALES